MADTAYRADSMVPPTISAWLQGDTAGHERDLRIAISGEHFIVSLWAVVGGPKAKEPESEHEICVISAEGTTLPQAFEALLAEGGLS